MSPEDNLPENESGEDSPEGAHSTPEPDANADDATEVFPATTPYNNADAPTTAFDGGDAPTTPYAGAVDGEAGGAEANAAPPYPAGQEPYSQQSQQQMNVLAILSLIGAFVIAPLGFILGHISLSQIKKRAERGRGLALAGTILGYVFTALWLIIAAVSIVIASIAVNEISKQELPNSTDQGQEQTQPSDPDADDDGLNDSDGDDSNAAPDSGDSDTPSNVDPKVCEGLDDLQAASQKLSSPDATEDDMDDADKAFKKVQDNLDDNDDAKLIGDFRKALQDEDTGKIEELNQKVDSVLQEAQMGCIQ
jgi:hypothetical protein